MYYKMNNEQWVNHPDLPNHFLLSNFGRVQNTHTNHITCGHIKKGQKDYYQITVSKNNKNKHFKIHRLMTIFLSPPDTPDQICIDHINGNSLDNNHQNLRWASYQQNACNAKKWSNKVLPKGVTYRKDNNKYRARIRYHNHLITIGQYTSIDEASNAYKTKADELFGEFAFH